MEKFNSCVLKNFCAYCLSHNFTRSVYTSRNISLFYGNNKKYMNSTILNNLVLRKRKFHGVINSYYDKFVSQLKKEIKNDKLLQDDIAFLKKKVGDLYFKISNKSSFTSFYFSNTHFNIAILYKINQILSNLKFFMAKISLIFSQLITSDFFSKNLIIVKNLFYDEASESKIERELSNWKFDRNQENPVGKINIHDNKIRNFDNKNDIKAYGIENSVVLHNLSLKDRFGAKLKNMSLLKNIFENKYIEIIFNRNKISRAVKEMKAINPNFKLPDFITIFEAYILPKFMDSYYTCDEHKLRLHCGDTAYRQFYSNIMELKKMGLSFNTKILQLGDIELKGAESSEVIFSYKDIKLRKSQPILIFTFKTQQINCLQDHNGRIISGSFDDIRELQYSISVTPHPNINVLGLEYPYLITELSVIGSTPIL
ncbi:mitochondrial import inner translocase subunit TIM44 [Cryptosporidium ubiquitum]|uniref:Mitochondrial import inner translocase subunit TIM44 n=1 Tax=Cryptosporidium ubiquitum TaxID=857276 RepID=A0A1J4MML9_9CRYT|nr:mitochondrial import inner translocase subunit TIM44 [Cryptosporidium ubiquitum]OII74260.1 mitochondrial import inner translocase subunit TIM44 [Cryptosporidium ubiquitum]